jgi:glucosyl-dolichyl phosphate glucuronosyltransferase
MLSVVIPTRDRSDLLFLALDSLCNQTLSLEQFEILVVDNGSIDDTKDIACSFTGRLPNLRYFYRPEPGLHTGRHCGLIESKGDILVYADDDIQANPTWLAAIAENFLDSMVAMVGGNNYPDFKVLPPPWLQTLWEQPRYGGRSIPALSVISLPEGRHEITPYQIWGCNFSIRKQVLLDAGGFHPDGMPQDHIRFRGDGETHISKYVSQNGLRCMFDSRASVLHAVTPERMTMAYFKKRAFNQGVSDSYTWCRQRFHFNKTLLKVFGICYQIKYLAQLLRDIIQNTTNPSSPELRQLQKNLRVAYWQGFRYHQDCYHQDSEVYRWVHQEIYF